MKASVLRFLIYPLIVLRLLTPFLLFINPFLAILFSFILDGLDGVVFNLAGHSFKTYQSIDKPLDFYWFIFILFYLISAQLNPLLFWVFLFFFIIRLIGEILYFWKKNDAIFIYCPNVFEHLFWVYIFCQSLHFPKWLSFPWIIIVLVVLASLTIVDEYLIHQKRFSFLNFFTGKKILTWKS